VLACLVSCSLLVFPLAVNRFEGGWEGGGRKEGGRKGAMEGRLEVNQTRRACTSMTERLAVARQGGGHG
jgi:hypothetical protein